LGRLGTYWIKGVDEGALLVTQFGVEESLFGLSQIEVKLVSKRDNIDEAYLLSLG